MGDSCRFSQSHAILGLTVDGDWNAGFSTDSMDTAKYNHWTILIMGDASLAGNAVLTLYGGAAAGDTTAAATFAYRYASGDVGSASSDVFGTVATSAALTTTATSMDSRVTIIEFQASDLNISGTQYRYATLVVSSDGSAGTCDIIAIGSEPRYSGAIMPTAEA
jgi:outer membrane usher protein FimD/PapC